MSLQKISSEEESEEDLPVPVSSKSNKAAKLAAVLMVDECESEEDVQSDASLKKVDSPKVDKKVETLASDLDQVKLEENEEENGNDKKGKKEKKSRMSEKDKKKQKKAKKQQDEDDLAKSKSQLI